VFSGASIGATGATGSGRCSSSILIGSTGSSGDGAGREVASFRISGGCE
jgi:hypothetical protein